MRKDARHPSVLDTDKDRTQIASTNFDRSCSQPFREKIANSQTCFFLDLQIDTIFVSLLSRGIVSSLLISIFDRPLAHDAVMQRVFPTRRAVSTKTVKNERNRLPGQE